MHNNKQDFVPPLVVYGIVYLANTEGFLYFLNKAYRQLGYHSANELLYSEEGMHQRFLLTDNTLCCLYVMICNYMFHVCNIKICCSTINQICEITLSNLEE